MKRLLAIVIPLYALDQATKLWVVGNIELDGTRPVVPGLFNMVYYINTGAAFSIMRDNNTFFIILSAIVLTVLAVMGIRGAFREKAAQIPLALLVAGILGNLTDRIWHHHVVDFADFYIGPHHWPAFNVADSCICVAAGLF